MTNFPEKACDKAVADNDNKHIEGIKKNRKAGSCYSGFSVVRKGGMGTILRTTDTNCGRDVAMKMSTSSKNGSEALERLLHEARITANLEHPNIVPVHEINCDSDNNVYFTMKYVQGDNLDTVVSMLRKNDPAYCKNYSVATLLNIFLRICDGMSFAHSKGVIHRDLKPENVMVGDYGEVLIMDWGIAKVLTETAAESSLNDSNFIANNFSREIDIKKTQCGAVFGTPAFMAPEQIRGENESVDKRTDIYAMGGILYTLLTLRYPIMESDINELFAKAVAGHIVPPSKLKCSKNKRLFHLNNNNVPEPLSAVVMKALAVDPGQRYQDIFSLQKDINAYLGGFATQAEHASHLRRLALLFNRHSLLTLLLFLIAGTAFFSFYKDTVSAQNSKEPQSSYGTKLAGMMKSNDSDKLEIEWIDENIENLIVLAEKSFLEGKVDDAKVIIEALEVFEPDNYKVYYMKGLVLEKQQSYQGASVAYKRALKRSPGFAGASLGLKRCQRMISRDQ